MCPIWVWPNANARSSDAELDIDRGGWKCGYITCTILRRSRVWYDWNVNNVPMSCLSPYAWWDTEMAGRVVLHHCWWRSKSDHTNLPILDCGDLYMKFFSSQCWNTRTNSAIEFRPPGRRKNASACRCSNSTYVSITYMQLKYWFFSSLRSTSGCYCYHSSIACCALKKLPAYARKGYERVHRSREPSFIIISLSPAAKHLISKGYRNSAFAVLNYYEPRPR